MLKIVCDFCGETPKSNPYDVKPHDLAGNPYAQYIPTPTRHICQDCLNYAKARLQS